MNPPPLPPPAPRAECVAVLMSPSKKSHTKPLRQGGEGGGGLQPVVLIILVHWRFFGEPGHLAPRRWEWSGREEAYVQRRGHLGSGGMVASRM